MNHIERICELTEELLGLMALDYSSVSPIDWLENPVTADGTGYCIAAPTGALFPLTAAERTRLAVCYRALAGIPAEDIEELVRLGKEYYFR